MPCALLSSSLLDVFRRPVRRGWRRGWRGCRRACALRRLRRSSPAPSCDIDLVIVRRVQRRGGRRRHPGGVGAGLRDGRSSAPASPPSGRASPTCPCRSAHGRRGRIQGRCRRSSSRRPAIQVAAFMSPLRIIGPASIEVWISSPVRSRKPVLMKTTRDAGGADAFLEVDRRAAFLVHDAHLDACSAPCRELSRPGRRVRWRRRLRPARASSA